MMLLLRMLKVIILCLRGRRLRPLDESRVSFRVWPNDLDLNFHMNNGRYLTIMDLGRVDLMIRVGIARAALRGRWRPMVAAATIRYRRALPPWARFDLVTRILCWDEKWFFMEHRFERGGEVCALALVKGLFVGPHDKITPQEVAQAVGHTGESPPMPPEVRAWLAWEHPEA